MSGIRWRDKVDTAKYESEYEFMQKGQSTVVQSY